jgi:hypothetical protein
MAGRVYSKEEAEAILARAIELQVHQGATSHDDLVAAAKEVGVSAATIERAASEVLVRKRDDAEMRELRARQWRGLYAHLVPYLMVNALLAFLNFETGGFPWVIIVLLGWGIGLASHLVAVALPDQQKLRRRLERDRAREERRRSRYRGRVEDPGAVGMRVAMEGGELEEQAAVEEAEASEMTTRGGGRQAS